MSARDLLLAAVSHHSLTPVAMPFLPELDGKIFVRVLNAAERHLYGGVALGARAQGQVVSDYEVVAICACDADGAPLFHKRDDDGRISIDADAVNKLRLVDGRAVHAIALKALQVSGMDVGARDAAKKNSASSQNEESSSDSPPGSDAP